MTSYDNEENAVVNNEGGVSETPSDLVAPSEDNKQLSPNPAGFGFTKQLIVDSLPDSGQLVNTLYLLRIFNDGVVVGYKKYKWTPTDGYVFCGVTPDTKLQDGPRETPVHENTAPRKAPEKVFNGQVVFNEEPYIQGRPLSDWVEEHDVDPVSANLIEKNYAELKALRDAGKLEPGVFYRITDYTFTTVTSNTSSAGHRFDIIVLATSESELSEDAWAIKHQGDTYFSYCNLNAWKLKYCLDNSTSRFEWADSVNGKGVIYYLKDDRGNECPYDFKNALFKITVTATSPSTTLENVYTFCSGSSKQDATIINDKNCCNNVIKEHKYNNTIALNKITFYHSGGVYAFRNYVGPNSYNCIFSTSYDCIYETYIHDVVMGHFASYNHFKGEVANCVFGSSFSHNEIGTAYRCTFGNNVLSNKIVNALDCTFDNYFTHCEVKNTVSTCSFAPCVKYCCFEGYCAYINLVTSDESTPSLNNSIQHIHVHPGVTGASSENPLTITVPERNASYSIDYYATNSQEVYL